MPDLDLAYLSDLPKDTGWRNIANLLHPSYALADAVGYLHARRVGGTVHIAGRLKRLAIDLSSPSYGGFLMFPEGFQPVKKYAAYGAAVIGATPAVLGTPNDKSWLRSIPDGPVNGLLIFEIRYETAATWPTVLPGTAA